MSYRTVNRIGKTVSQGPQNLQYLTCKVIFKAEEGFYDTFFSRLNTFYVGLG